MTSRGELDCVQAVTLSGTKLRESANVCTPPRRLSVTANSKNHPTQQSAAALPIKRYAAAYGVRDGRLQYIVVDPLLFLADPNQPNAADADRQASRAKRKFLSKSAAKQKMRASEQGWAALRSAIFRPIDHTVPVPGKSELDLALPFLGQMRRR
jgi:hypothetical protein